jgi:hypothetical protein
MSPSKFLQTGIHLCLSSLTALLIACGGANTQAPTGAPPMTAAPMAAEPTPTGRRPVPNWTVNGSDEKRGVVVLRCENAFPPEDGSGKCMCEGYELSICADGTRQLSVDRKQCGFICKPRPTNGSQIAIKCPDGGAVAAVSHSRILASVSAIRQRVTVSDG